MGAVLVELRPNRGAAGTTARLGKGRRGVVADATVEAAIVSVINCLPMSDMDARLAGIEALIARLTDGKVQ